MDTPEGMIDWQDRSPKHDVVGSRIRAGAGHPFQVRQDIGVLFKPLPVCRLVCTDDGGVVLCPQPMFYMMIQHRVYVVFPLFEWF